MGGTHIPPEPYKAYITVITKLNKDLLSPNIDCAICLLNIHIKIVTSIIAQQINRCLHVLIHRDQVGFFPIHQTPHN